MSTIYDTSQFTAEGIYERFTTDTPELSEPYRNARLAIYEADSEPQGLLDALEQLDHDHYRGVLRPPLPAVLANTIHGVLKSAEQGQFDVFDSGRQQKVASALLDVATRFEVLRFATDPSWQERSEALAKEPKLQAFHILGAGV